MSITVPSVLMFNKIEILESVAFPFNSPGDHGEDCCMMSHMILSVVPEKPGRISGPTTFPFLSTMKVIKTLRLLPDS